MFKVPFCDCQLSKAWWTVSTEISHLKLLEQFFSCSFWLNNWFLSHVIIFSRSFPLSDDFFKIPLTSRNFCSVNLHLLKLQLPLRRSYLHLSLYFRSSHYLHSTYVMKQHDQQNNNKMIKSTKRLTSYLLDYLASDIYTRNYADFSQAPF